MIHSYSNSGAPPLQLQIHTEAMTTHRTPSVDASVELDSQRDGLSLLRRALERTLPPDPDEIPSRGLGVKLPMLRQSVLCAITPECDANGALAAQDRAGEQRLAHWVSAMWDYREMQKHHWSESG